MDSGSTPAAGSTSVVRMLIKPHGNGSKLWINGQEIKHLRSFRLSEVAIDTPVVLTVDLVGVEVEVEGEVAATETDTTDLSAQARQFEKGP